MLKSLEFSERIKVIEENDSHTLRLVLSMQKVQKNDSKMYICKGNTFKEYNLLVHGEFRQIETQ